MNVSVFYKKRVHELVLNRINDKHRNSETLIEFMLPKLNSANYVIRCLKHYSTLETLKMAHQAYFHSAMVYGIIFWGNSINNNKVCLQQKVNYEVNIGN